MFNNTAKHEANLSCAVIISEPRHDISNNVVWHPAMYDQQSLRSACAYAQSNQSLYKSLEYSLTVKLLNDHHLESLSLNGQKEAAQTNLSLHLSKCHVVGNTMPFLMYEPLRKEIRKMTDASDFVGCTYHFQFYRVMSHISNKRSFQNYLQSRNHTDKLFHAECNHLI